MFSAFALVSDDVADVLRSGIVAASWAGVIAAVPFAPGGEAVEV
jgi:hypothetical protein